MKYLLIVASILALCIGSAEAKHRHVQHYTRHQVQQPTKCVEANIIIPTCGMVQPFSGAATIKVEMRRERPSRAVERVVSREATATQVVGGRPSGCPNAFCGCSASLKLFGRIIPELNLAANWGKFPPAAPAPGMAAYRSHHVFVILAVNSDGTVLAHDGNSGHHLTRVHVVSLRGYRVVNPHA